MTKEESKRTKKGKGRCTSPGSRPVPLPSFFFFLDTKHRVFGLNGLVKNFNLVSLLLWLSSKGVWPTSSLLIPSFLYLGSLWLRKVTVKELDKTPSRDPSPVLETLHTPTFRCPQTYYDWPISRSLCQSRVSWTDVIHRLVYSYTCNVYENWSQTVLPSSY